MFNRQLILVSGLLLAMMASQSAWAQQIAQPDNTLDPGGFSPVGGPATLHEALFTTGISEYIDSGIANPTTGQISLSSVGDPGVGTGHILRFTCKVDGTKGPETCDVALYDGGTLIYSVSQQPSARGAWETFSFTLLETEANNISALGYADLTIHLTAGISNKAADADSAQFSWVEFEVPASASTAPEVTTDVATVSAVGEATVGGTVTGDGNDPLQEVGVYYSQTSGFTPPDEGTKFQITPVPSVPPGNFAGDLTSLPNGTTYYYRAYAINGIGGTYETNQESFTTWDVPTLLPTPTKDNIQLTSATLGGRVTDDGLTAVTECGVVWSDAPAPDRNDGNDFSAAAGSCDTGVDFTVAAGSLTAGTTYYFRSYAINAVGTAHSAEEGSFIASGPPELDATVDLGTVTATQALLGGNITNNGGSAVTAVGIYWDTIGTDPRNDGTHVPMTAAEPSFEQLVTGLTPGATIYFLAYATNGAGTTDSTIINFDTQAGAPTMDPTPTVDNIVANGADLGGTISADGGGANLDCGVEWTTVPGEPYESSQSFEGAPNNGTCVEGVPFAVTVSGLTSGQTYHFRAWATSVAGSDVSNPASFVPQAVPIVTAAAELNVTHNSADLGGNVTSDEGSAVSAKGIVWDTIPIQADPTLQPTATFVPMGSGIGSFVQTVSLPSGQTIYFEAYATNGAGTSYSNDNRSFTTLTEPTIQASNATITKFAGRSMRISWTRGNGDGSIVVIRETGTTSSVLPVDGDDYVGNPDFSVATPPPELEPLSNGNYVVHKGPENSVWVTRLNLNTSYSIAIYEYAGATPDYVQSNPALATQQTSTLAVHNEDLRINCDDCHNHGSFNARDAELSAICETCHNPDGTNEARFKTEFANHRPPTDNLDIDFVDCGMCHEVHNFNVNDTTESYHSVDEVPVINKSFLRANVDKYVPTATPPAYLPDTDQPYRVGPPEILANTPDRAVEGGVEAVEPSTPTQARGYCQVCHTLTKYHRSTNLTGGLGSNQAHDGNSNNSGLGTEVNCGECHEHNNNFTGVGGSQTCVECHDSIQTNGELSRRIIMTEFDLQSSHITGGSSVVTQADCEVCHDFATHEGQLVTVFDVDNFNNTFAQVTEEVPATDPGEGAAMSPHCLSCHADGYATALEGGAPEQTPTSPFTDSQAPDVLNLGDTSLWDNAGHNRPLTAPRNGCVGCHGGHGSAQNNLLTSAPVFPTGATGSIFATDFCIKCHGSGGPSSKNIAAEFDTGTDYQVTGMNGAANNQRHDVILADQTYSSSAIGCGDCHLPHVDNSTSPVRNPDTGAVLPTYSISTAGGSGSWNGMNYDLGGNLDPSNPEGGGSVSEPDYIQFCLVCHDGTPAGNSTVAYNVGSSYFGSRGGKQHGNGEGGDGSSTGKGNLKPPWTTQADYDAGLDPSAPYAALNCTTCHGPHGTGNIYNLRESITVGGQPMSTGGKPGSDFENIVTTTYTLPDNGSGQEKDVYGAWCTFCHNMNAHADVTEVSNCNSGHRHGGNNF